MTRKSMEKDVAALQQPWHTIRWCRTLKGMEAGVGGQVPDASSAVLRDSEHTRAVRRHVGCVDTARVAQSGVAFAPTLQHCRLLHGLQVPQRHRAVKQHYHRHPPVPRCRERLDTAPLVACVGTQSVGNTIAPGEATPHMINMRILNLAGRRTGKGGEACGPWQAPGLYHAVARDSEQAAALGQGHDPAHANIVPLQHLTALCLLQVPHEGAIIAYIRALVLDSSINVAV